MPAKKTLNREQYWRRTRRLTFVLLAVWSLVNFGVIMSARALSGITFFGWSLSYYMAAQGTILVYVAIIGFHTWRMSRLDKLFADEETHGR